MAQLANIVPAYFLGAMVNPLWMPASAGQSLITVVNGLTSGATVISTSGTVATGALTVTGIASASTSILSPLFDALIAGVLNIGTTIATSIALKQNTVLTGTLVASGKITSTGEINKPATATVACGSAITAAMLLTGYIEVTGTTGNCQFDTAANITTALGTSPAGTTFDFYINTMGAIVMTAGNICTVTTNTGLQFMKQISASDSASVFLATITGTAGVHSGWFRLTYDTATTASIQRIG